MPQSSAARRAYNPSMKTKDSYRLATPDEAKNAASRGFQFVKDVLKGKRKIPNPWAL